MAMDHRLVRVKQFGDKREMFFGISRMNLVIDFNSRRSFALVICLENYHKGFKKIAGYL